MPSVKISELTEKTTMVGTEEVLINDSGTSKKFSTQRFLDVKTAAETAQTAAELAETNVAADLVLTNADVVLTHADVALTNADVVLTHADVVLAEADKVQTGLDRAAVAADLILTAADTVATAADKVATNADVVLTGLDVDATNADVVLTNADVVTATAQAGIATTQAGIATTKAGEASTSASAASTSASNASTSETNAGNSASSATSAQSASEAARDSALAAFDSFDDRYLGQKATAPTLDNDGAALVAGTLYFNTGTNEMKVYDGSAWLNAYASLSGALLATNNLSDLNNAGTARTNLGVDAAGTVNYTHPATHAISVTTGLQTALDAALPKAGGTMTGDVSLGDNVKAKFGAGDDLQIYHTGIHSYIRDAGTGDLVIQGNNLRLANADWSKGYLTATDGGAVSINYDGATKLATTSTGIDVTGSVVVSGTVDGRDVATDGSKLDGIATSANNYVHPTTAGNKHIPTAGAAGQFLKYSASGTAVWAADNNTVYTHPSHPGDDFSVDTGALTGATVISDIDINVTTDTSGHVTDANGVVSTRTLTLADLGYTAPASFPSGTKMVFAQAAAPTGWTQDITNNDKALRVVSGLGGGTGGTHAFSSPPSTAHTHSFSDSSATTSSAGAHSHTGPSHTHTGPSHTHSTPSHSHTHTLSAGAHTLTTAQMPSHNHSMSVIPDCYTYHGTTYFKSINQCAAGVSTKYTNSTGGGSSHSHSLSGSITSGGSGTSGAGGTGATGLSGTGATSSAAAHTHTVAVSGTSGSSTPTVFAPQYVDVIVCSKN